MIEDAATIERRNRIRVALFAYAYEIMNDSLIPDTDYDALCLRINLDQSTDRPDLDSFFRKEFDPSTGMWIYKHPDWQGIAGIYQRLTRKMARPIPAYKNELPPVSTSVSNMGFRTHSDMKLYLASLGLCVIDDWQIIGNRSCHFEYEKDLVRVTDTNTGEQKTTFYRDIFQQSE